MNLAEVCRVLAAEVVSGREWLDKEADCACGADLMSDVLAFTKERALLLTGQTNVQVIRTAEMSDLVAIVVVRGKRPGAELIELAIEKRIPLLVSEHAMFEACGLLFVSGLGGCFDRRICCGD